MAIQITDPTYNPQEKLGIFERVVGKALSNYLIDARDLPFITLTASIVISVIPLAILLYTLPDFPWWLGLAHLVLTLLYFLGPVILMLHCTSHRPLFKQPYQKWTNRMMWVFIYPLFGEVAQSYFSHHLAMHHSEENLKNDLSTTMFSQRDSVIDFGKYLGDFYLFGFLRILIYLKKTGRNRLFRKTLFAELSFYAVVIGLANVNFKATLYVFIIPFLVSRFGMMAGNWAQHAFIDASSPENSFRNSITCINTMYNRRCFNDGYHIGHHLSATRHWTDMPADFLKNKKKYIDEKAIVFEGIDYFQIWFFLMIKRYDVLAKHLVHLDDSETALAPNREKQIQFLRERTQRISPILVPVEQS